MATATPVDLGRFNLYSVDRMRFTIKRDGAAWQGIDSVLARFEAPDRVTTFDRSLVLENDPLGIWYYDTAVTDFDDPTSDVGRWTVNIKITDAGIVKWFSEEISFEVVDLP